MEKFTEDLNIIRSLPDNPALTSDDFRSKFDEAGKKIKEYLNNIVLPEVESKAGEEELRTLSTNLNTRIDESLEELEGNVNEAINTLTTSVNESLQSMNNTIGGKVASGDFVITTHNQDVEPPSGYNYETRDTTATKSGYKALGCIGWTVTNNVGDVRVYGVRTTSIGNGTITIQLKTYGNTSGRNNATFNLSILWVKQ